MEKREKIALFFWLLICFFFTIESWRLGLGSFNALGPGFLPFGVSLFIGLLVLVIFLNERGKKLIQNATPLFRGKNWRNVIYSLSSLFTYALLLDKLGFFLCTLFFTGFCIKVIGLKKWRVTLVASISVAIVSYMIFDVWLDIRPPKGKLVERFFH